MKMIIDTAGRSRHDVVTCESVQHAARSTHRHTQAQAYKGKRVSTHGRHRASDTRVITPSQGCSGHQNQRRSSACRHPHPRFPVLPSRWMQACPYHAFCQTSTLQCMLILHAWHGSHSATKQHAAKLLSKALCHCNYTRKTAQGPNASSNSPFLR